MSEAHCNDRDASGGATVFSASAPSNGGEPDRAFAAADLACVAPDDSAPVKAIRLSQLSFSMEPGK